MWDACLPYMSEGIFAKMIKVCGTKRKSLMDDLLTHNLLRECVRVRVAEAQSEDESF